MAVLGYVSRVIQAFGNTADLRANLDRAQVVLRRDAAGFAVSATVHLLALLLIIFVLRRPEVTAGITHVLPVDIVHLGPETEAPASAQKSPVPQQAHPLPGRSASRSPAGVSHDEKKPIPEDAFDAKLRALAQLRQPDAKLQPLENSGADESTAGAGNGQATYSLRDFVRAQVLRHWNLDYSTLGDKRLTIAIRVEMTNHGVITLSDIVDKGRYSSDPIFREIALSARNAVTLSSPIPLPPGSYQRVMRFVLNLDPRDTSH